MQTTTAGIIPNQQFFGDPRKLQQLYSLPPSPELTPTLSSLGAPAECSHILRRPRASDQ